MTTLVPGLCSVTLRAESIATVADVAASCELHAIEWGGDIHVPPGDLIAARRARTASDNAGIHMLTYGSYLLASWPFDPTTIEGPLGACTSATADRRVTTIPTGRRAGACRDGSASEVTRRHITKERGQWQN